MRKVRRYSGIKESNVDMLRVLFDTSYRLDAGQAFGSVTHVRCLRRGEGDVKRPILPRNYEVLQVATPGRKPCK